MTVHLDGDFGAARRRFWGGVSGSHFLHCACTGAAEPVSALLLLSHAGRSVGRVLAAVGELLSAEPVA